MQPPSSKSDAPDAGAPSSAPVIVVADDNAVLRLAARSILERNGFQCLLANDGQEAMALIQQALPQAVILDLKMPNMDGFEVLRQMRSSEEMQKIPVLLVTGCRDPEVMAIGTRLGSEYMPKPFKPNELLVRLKRLLE